MLLGFAGLTAGIAVIGNLPVTWFMSAERATLKYLEKSRLQTIETNPRTFNVRRERKRERMNFCLYARLSISFIEGLKDFVKNDKFKIFF